MVSGRYFLPEDPLTCVKATPDGTVTSVNVTVGGSRRGAGAAMALA
jgi:hypothetical protein